MQALFRQFAHPRGFLGWLVGHAMARKNGARSRFALELLKAGPGERVLEIGFGPGVDVARLAAAVGPAGLVAGVDASSEMLRHATRRNRAAVRAGRIVLALGEAAKLPFLAASFDAVYATNSAQFWGDLVTALGEVRRVLLPGGRVVLVVQPMWRGATREDTLTWGEKLRAALSAAGFIGVETREAELRPVLATGALARTPLG